MLMMTGMLRLYAVYSFMNCSDIIHPFHEPYMHHMMPKYHANLICSVPPTYRLCNLSVTNLCQWSNNHTAEV